MILYKKKNRVEKRFFHELVKKEMTLTHQKNSKFVPDKYQKTGFKPLIDWTKVKAFDDANYPGVEHFPIVIPKKQRPLWEPKTDKEVEKRFPYMNGVKEEEFFEAKAEHLKGHFSWKTATKRELIKLKIAKAVAKFGKFKGDTGSTPVQIAILTIRIKSIERKLKREKDIHNKRSLVRLKERRKGLMKYLLRNNSLEYYKTLKHLNMPLHLQGPNFQK